MRVTVIAILVFAGREASADDIEKWVSYEANGDGTVSFHVNIRNNGKSEICCRVQYRVMTPGNGWYSDSRRLCAYPDRESFTGVQAVTAGVGCLEQARVLNEQKRAGDNLEPDIFGPLKDREIPVGIREKCRNEFLWLPTFRVSNCEAQGDEPGGEEGDDEGN